MTFRIPQRAANAHRSATLVGLALVLGACGESIAPPTSVQPSHVERAATAAPPTALAADILSERVGAAFDRLGPSMRALTTTAQAGDREAFAVAVADIRGWADTERDWLDQRPSDRCSTVAYDTYGEAIGDMGRATMDLELVSDGFYGGDVAASVIESSIALLDEAWDRLLAAQVRAVSETCPPQQPSASALDVPFTAAAYRAFADDVNQRFDDLQAAGLPPVAFAVELTELEEEILAVASGWRDQAADLDALEDAIADVKLLLTRVPAAITDEDARTRVRFTYLALIHQRAAADAIRSKFGLPSTENTDLL